MASRPGKALHPLVRLVAAVASTGVFAVHATEIPLYQVQVALAGKTEADRAAGFQKALAAAAVRASGRREAATNATITGADPARYVQRYSTSADGRLSVGFDDRGLGSLLAQAGLPFWAAERPLTVIEAPGADRAQGDGAAQWRGLPVQWSDSLVPSDSGADRASLRGARSGSGYDWTFTHAGQTVQGRGSITDGINLAADTLADRYAPPSTRATSTIEFRIAGITDLRAYASVLSYLTDLSIVRDVSVDGLEGEVVRVNLTMRGDRQLLGRLAAMDGRLAPGDADPAAPGPRGDFVYLP